MRKRSTILSVIFSFLVLPFCAADDWRNIKKDVVYGHKAGMALTYDVVQGEKPNGAAVLFMVSGGWVSRHFPVENVIREESTNHNLFEKVVKNGYTLFLVRHGSSPHFKVPDAVNDVQRAIRHIRANADDHGIDVDRIGVCGGSAGGHLSLVLGTMGKDAAENPGVGDPGSAGSRVAAVVAYFPPTDLREYVDEDEPDRRFPALHFSEAKADDVSPLLAVTSDDAPTLLIHGDQDDLVPLWHSEKFLEAMKGENCECELIVLKGAGHGFTGEQKQRAEQALLDWFNKYLGDD